MDSDAFDLKRLMKQEAHEKAFEISVLGQRVFEKSKDEMVKKGFANATAEHDQKMDQLKMDINIERSTKTNATKLEKYKARNQCLDNLRSNIHSNL
jgi:hypothetical protein